jgi:phenylalanyl-tRNA synthetase beta chain
MKHMLIPLAWLREYVELPPNELLLERLTEIGHMVDAPLRPTDGGPIVSLEVRQNRPDCLSIVGIAREVAAAFGLCLREVALAPLPEAVRPLAAESEDVITFLRLHGTALDRLPREILRRLEHYGQRSVAPLVDLANYVMMELGQPLHVYAADRVDVQSMAARRARDGERLALIDGGIVNLDQDDLIIADQHGPVALAGVMGGRESAVGTGHGDIVVEAGTFRPHLVRRSARRHGIQSEASLRSSKLLPPELAPRALRRFLALLRTYGQVESVEMWQTPRVPAEQPPIQLAYRDIARIGGVAVPTERAVTILDALGFTVAAADVGSTIVATPPWWRTDIHHAADLIEEILRIVGYAQIEPRRLSALPPDAPTANAWGQEEQVRDLLCAWGCDEVILDTFLIDAAGRLAPRQDVVGVQNPPAGSGILRPSLLPNMLSAARFLPLHISERRLFEVGHIFHTIGGMPQEQRAVAWVLLRGSGTAGWGAEAASDMVYQLKAEALAVLAALGAQAMAESGEAIPYPFLPRQAIRLLDAHGQTVCVVGALDHRAYGVSAVQQAIAVEVYLPSPSADRATSIHRARREVEHIDLSVALTTTATATAVAQVISGALGEDGVDIWLIDVYPHAGADSRPQSVTFRVVYDARRGTPKVVWEELRRQVEQRLGVRVRA